MSREEVEFLTIYDYGQGAVWTLIIASSADEVAAKYPELRVVDEPPETMSREEFDRIRGHRQPVHVDDLDHPFLRALREGRDR